MHVISECGICCKVEMWAVTVYVISLMVKNSVRLWLICG